MKSTMKTLQLITLITVCMLAGCGSATESTVSTAPTTPSAPPRTDDQIDTEDTAVEGEAYQRELQACSGSNIVCTVSVFARATEGSAVSHNSPAAVARNFENSYSISCAAGRCTIQRRNP